MMKKPYTLLYVLSLLIATLLIFVSIAGISSGTLYANETPAWRLQCYGQDLVDLFLVTPCLILSGTSLLNRRLFGKLTWPGIMLYLIYSFTIYCFDVHFNELFIEYCAIFGLSIFSLLYFFYRTGLPEDKSFSYRGKFINVVAVFLFATGVLFCALWLSQIIPAIRSNSSPKGLEPLNLPTNPVHVLDLAIYLPLFMITAMLLLRKNHMGLNLATYLLVFSVLMDITILTLNIMMHESAVLTVVFATLTLVTLVLLIGLIRHNYKNLEEDKTTVLWENSKL
jgi:hypothetical protein